MGNMVDRKMLAANLIINVADTAGLVLLYVYWKNRKNNLISLRRPELMLISVIYPAVLDYIWTIDTLTAPKTLGVPCVWWELLISLYYPIFMEVLALRAIVLYLSFNKAKVVQDALTSGDNSSPKTEEEIKFNLSPAQVKELQRLSFYTSSKFLGKLISGLVVLHSIPYMIHIAVNPDLATQPFFESLECYGSWPYNLNIYFQIFMSLVVLYTVWLLRDKKDIYYVKAEIAGLAAFWIAYNLFQFGIYQWLAEAQPETYFYSYAYIWLVFFGVYYIVFLGIPLYMIRREESHNTEQSQLSNTAPESPRNLEGKVSKAFVRFLSNRVCYNIYLKALTKEFSHENLLFWKQVQEFNSIKTRIAADGKGDASAAKEAVAKALDIYTTYISTDAALPINLSHRCFLLYRTKDWSALNEENVASFGFEEAETEILLLMQNDSFSRFKHTQDFKKCAEILDMQDAAHRDTFVISTVVAVPRKDSKSEE